MRYLPAVSGVLKVWLWVLYKSPTILLVIIIFIRANIMDFVVIADFKCKDGMASEMSSVLREALIVTRGFDGCNATDVYFVEKTNTYILIEDWDSLEQYEVYLQFRKDGGIAELLDPILADGWGGVKASIKQLGNITDI